MIIRTFLALALFLLSVRSIEAFDYPPIPSQPIDMNRDGRDDFHLTRFLYMTDFPMWDRQETLRLGTHDPFAEQRPENPNGNSALVEDGQVALLSPGDVIGGITIGGRQWVDAFGRLYVSQDNSLLFEAPGSWEGIWGARKEGFTGVRIVADDGLHYGWIKLRVENWSEATPNGTRVNGPTAIDWYLESTPNMPIVAGAVPEAGTVVLGVVGAAVVLVVGWRRRVRRKYSHTECANDVG